MLLDICCFLCGLSCFLLGFGWFVCFWMDLLGFDHCLFVPVSFHSVLCFCLFLIVFHCVLCVSVEFGVLLFLLIYFDML